MCECVLFAVCSVVFLYFLIEVYVHMCEYKRLLIVCLLRYLGVC